MIRKSLILTLFTLLLVESGFSQSLNDPLFQGATSQGTSPDCTDPTLAGTPQCMGAASQRSGGTVTGRDINSFPVKPPVLTMPPGSSAEQNNEPPPLNPSQVARPQTPPRPETEF